MKQCWNALAAVVLMGALMVPPLAAAAAEIILPEGTRITLQLNDTLSTRFNAEGDAFTAVVTAPVYLEARMIIPKGSVVNGSISRIIRPGRLKGKAILDLMFQSIKIPGRRQMTIVATLVGVDPEANAEVRSEGRVVAEGSAGSDVRKVLVPSLAGAGIGTATGGGKGAGIGAGVGAAIGLASIFTSRGKDLEIHRGSTLDIQLDRSLAIPSEANNAALE